MHNGPKPISPDNKERPETPRSDSRREAAPSAWISHSLAWHVRPSPEASTQPRCGRLLLLLLLLLLARLEPLETRGKLLLIELGPRGARPRHHGHEAPCSTKAAAGHRDAVAFGLALLGLVVSA